MVSIRKEEGQVGNSSISEKDGELRMLSFVRDQFSTNFFKKAKSDSPELL